MATSYTTPTSPLDATILLSSRLRAEARLADHDAGCAQCGPEHDLFTYGSLLKRCRQGRVLRVNANRADDLYLRALQVQVQAETQRPARPSVARKGAA